MVSQLEAERKSHHHTKTDLEKTRAELDKMRMMVDKINKEQEEKLQLVRTEVGRDLDQRKWSVCDCMRRNKDNGLEMSS